MCSTEVTKRQKPKAPLIARRLRLELWLSMTTPTMSCLAKKRQRAKAPAQAIDPKNNRDRKIAPPRIEEAVTKVAVIEVAVVNIAIIVVLVDDLPADHAATGSAGNVYCQYAQRRQGLLSCRWMYCRFQNTSGNAQAFPP